MSLQASMAKIRESLNAKAKPAKSGEGTEQRTLAGLAALALAASTESEFAGVTLADLAGLALAEPQKPHDDSFCAEITEWHRAVMAVPAPSNRDGERLLNTSLTFLASDNATLSHSCGWDAIALFGIHRGTAPRERIDAWGLVTTLAWSALKLSIKDIAADQCVLASQNAQGGSELTFKRDKTGLSNAVPWWRYSVLIGGENE
jgi:hypothetical protein